MSRRILNSKRKFTDHGILTQAINYVYASSRCCSSDERCDGRILQPGRCSHCNLTALVRLERLELASRKLGNLEDGSSDVKTCALNTRDNFERTELRSTKRS